MGANVVERCRYRRANLCNVRAAKTGLFDQTHRAVRAIQFKLRPPAARLDGMDMRRRMIVGVDRHTDISDGQDGRHG